MVQIVVDRSGKNLICLDEKKTYEIGKAEGSVIVKTWLNSNQQEKVMKETKLPYTKMIKLVIPLASAIRKSVEDTANMIRADSKIKLNKKESETLTSSLTEIFKSLKQ